MLFIVTVINFHKLLRSLFFQVLEQIFFMAVSNVNQRNQRKQLSLSYV